MTDRDRLTKRKGKKVFINTDAISRETCKGDIGFHFCQYGITCDNLRSRECPVLKIFDKLAYYEDLEEQGRLIVPPCKVGDMIYIVGIFTGQVIPSEVVGIETTQNDMFLILANQTVVSVVYQLGKTVFLTKEEAEKALAKRSEDK